MAISQAKLGDDRYRRGIAHLQKVRAHLCDKWKNLHANSTFEAAVADLKAYAREKVAGVIASLSAQRVDYAFA